MQDLNNLYHFVKIVEHGSLSAAAEALGISKSVLSQRLARLEQELGVRLIQRTTRRMQVTAVGRRYFQHCRTVLAEVERAGRAVEDARSNPRGRVRLTSPVNFAQGILAPVLADFMAEYPDIEVLLDITNREVDLLADGYDFALRIAPMLPSSSLVVRAFRLMRHVLVASRHLVRSRGLPRHPAELRGWPSLAGVHGFVPGARQSWQLTGPGGETSVVAHTPRLLTEDIFVLKRAVLAGCGVAELPPICCRDELADGTLVQLLPGWQLPEMSLHAMFPSREGLSVAARCCVEYLCHHLSLVLDGATAGTMRVSVTPA